MKSILVLFVFILGVSASQNGSEILSREIQEILSLNDGINSVEYVGASADGKVFFKDLYNTERTWQETRKFCQGFKLEQSAVTTRLQLDFLLKSFSEKKLESPIWISARETRNVDMLTWDKTSSKVDLSVFKSYASRPTEAELPFQVCGTLSDYGTIYFMRCNLNRDVLCQTP